MGLLFVHDHKFRYINGNYYSPGGLSDQALSRYTRVFGKTVVMARVIKNETDDAKYTKITNENVAIVDGWSKNRSEFAREVAKADLLICRIPSVLGIRAIKLARKLKKPYLVEVVACPWDSYWNHSVKGKVAAPYMTWITKKLVKEAEYVLYVTEKFLQSRYPTDGISISCSNVALPHIGKEVLDKRMSRIKDAGRKKMILGTAAAVDVKYKGQQYVMKALGEMKKRGIASFEYQLVGSGDQTYLKKIAHKYNVSDQVLFIGSLPHNEVMNWLDQIDIYVQPSKQEGLPRALIEAMSRGVPAFGARTGGIPELLDEEFIFSHGRNCAKEICRILERFDDSMMIQQSRRNYHEAQKYTLDRLEKRRTEFFERFLKESKIREE